MIDVTVDGLKELSVDLSKFPGEIKKSVLLQLSQITYDEAQRGAGRHARERALFQSLYNRQVPEGRKVGHDRERAPHAPFVIQGTIPHEIGPNVKKSLRWAGPNGFIFAKLVHHPGYIGDPYMDTASDKALAQFNTILDAALKDAI